jgi:hypothetical protein
LAVQLKEQNGIDNILKENNELDFFEIRIGSNIKILQDSIRIARVISFFVEDLHFNLGVKLLNDKLEFKRVVVAVVRNIRTLLLHVDQETLIN